VSFVSPVTIKNGPTFRASSIALATPRKVTVVGVSVVIVLPGFCV